MTINSTVAIPCRLGPTTGKSVNAIRSFTGKEPGVEAPRTLAGSDNEWRYVNIRRLFIFVDKSVKTATEQFVFEPLTVIPNGASSRVSILSPPLLAK